jgi:hypothetical protein
LTVKFLVLERKDPLKWGMRLIPFYLAFTAGILALFILDELPNAPDFEEMGAGKVTGIILGVAGGVLAISYIFFVPYFHRRLIVNDARMRIWHIPLGPLLYRENPPIYWPGKGDTAVIDYYAKTSVDTGANDLEKADAKKALDESVVLDSKASDSNEHSVSTAVDASGSHATGTTERAGRGLSVPNTRGPNAHVVLAKPEPEERWLHPVRDLPFYSPKKLGNWAKYLLLQGVARDVVTQKSQYIYQNETSRY